MMPTEVFYDEFDVLNVLYRRTEKGGEAFPWILAYHPQAVVEINGPPDQGVLSDLSIDLLHVIVQSKEPSDEFLLNPFEENTPPLLPDGKDTIPCVNEIVIAKADKSKELTGVQGMVEVEITDCQGNHGLNPSRLLPMQDGRPRIVE
jgi:hypothetical protein